MLYVSWIALGAATAVVGQQPSQACTNSSFTWVSAVLLSALDHTGPSGSSANSNMCNSFSRYSQRGLLVNYRTFHSYLLPSPILSESSDGQSLRSIVPKHM